MTATYNINKNLLITTLTTVNILYINVSVPCNRTIKKVLNYVLCIHFQRTNFLFLFINFC